MELTGYSNLSKLATGGMATVYKARQISLNRSVAIKLLLAEYLWDDDAKGLFEQESLVIAQLNHPNIIHIIDRGISDKGRPYFVMGYIQGSELGQVIHKEKPGIRLKLSLLIQICKGMAAAHNNGVIHRDIKPSNILIDANEHVYILDFGIAWLAASGKPENIVGTPDYMSPEQFSNPGSVTHLSDIYSLGIIMYEMFSGQLPSGNRQNLEQPLQSLPPALISLILLCIQTEPDKRPSSADEIKLQLLSLTRGAHLNQRQKTEAISAFNNNQNKFILLDVIKKNDYSSVFLYENRKNHQLMVIKKHKNTFAGYQQANQLTELKHPNIINIYGTSKSQNAFIIVMEHLTGGSLQERLVRKYSLENFLPIAKNICEAMKFSHDNNITHGNLRPSNVLFERKNTIKLTDFGLNEHYRNRTNTQDWYQPNDQGCAAKTRDIYSTGAIFYRMLTGTKVTIQNKRILKDDAFTSLHNKLQNLLQDMLIEDNKNHYSSFDQVIKTLEDLELTETKEIRRKNRSLRWIMATLISGLIITAILIYMK